VSSESADVPPPPGEQPETPERTALTVPGDELAKYWNERVPDNKCAFCKVGEYALASSPSGDGTAAVVAAPIPNMQHLGMWFYVATCRNCGYVAFFNANSIVRDMSKV
jgi:predicted nucleic-acid-binding Zn-ribbon protein